MRKPFPSCNTSRRLIRRLRLLRLRLLRLHLPTTFGGSEAHDCILGLPRQCPEVIVSDRCLRSPEATTDTASAVLTETKALFIP